MNTKLIFSCTCGISFITDESRLPIYCRCGKIAETSDDTVFTHNDKITSQTQKRIQELPLSQKILTFGKAVINDIRHGMERCTEEEMDARLEICKGCPFFEERNNKSSCMKCGCPLSRDKIYRNKLYWKHESCPDKTPEHPDGRWPKLNAS